ncbi:hypothetical protein G8C92_13525 [Paenibacillus donghaensis]|uniref:hypothetical protein n=1 Tax=Paenibacillus TaxID=44249 RepID=UPI0018831591|nr:hypothetical protein [Paenibacillus donghaensis]MBE9915059.1 hypothetical protein [Paenibacillus donghaensis]
MTSQRTGGESKKQAPRAGKLVLVDVLRVAGVNRMKRMHRNGQEASGMWVAPRVVD